MELIKLTKENLESEHICCAISCNTDCQVAAKKEWLAARLDDGIAFVKGDVRGKCFIEYIPAENAWAPIDANGYDYIDCLWVSGRFKGQGSSTLLLNECIKDGKARGRAGLVILSSEKKLAFLSDSGFLRHKGFAVADTAAPYFTLMYLPYVKDAPVPKFKPCVGKCKDTDGFVLYYTKQCPFTAKYVPLVESVARDKGVRFKAIRFDSAQEAQNAPSPFTTYSLFYNGEFITHEILSENKFEKILQSKGF